MTRRVIAALPLVVLAVLAGSLDACSQDDGSAPAASATVTETVTVTADPTTSPGGGTSSATDEPDGPTTPPVNLSAPPTTYAEAMAHFDAASGSGTPQELARFEAPSGDIYCVLEDQFIAPSCELSQGAVEAPRVCGDSPATAVGRLEFGDGGPVPQCNTDTIRMPGAPVLRYGGVALAAGRPIRCVMEGIGVTCIDTEAEQGFFLAKGRYDVF